MSASLVLVTFMGCAGVLLDRTFREVALGAVEDRLRGRIFLLIGAADFDRPRGEDLIGALPDPSLSIPRSGNYARIMDRAREPRWESRSLAGVELIRPRAVAVGQWRLERIGGDDGAELFSLVYGIQWEGAGETEPRVFYLQASESAEMYHAAMRRFRQSLWWWFAALSAALLIVQGLNLSWGLRPLRRVGDEVRAIEQGRGELIEGVYPAELTGLTRNLNRLLAHNRDSLHRYRHALGDLAHAVKTPLAVLRNLIETSEVSARIDDGLEQIERIDRTVEYHLQRAATAGRSVMTPPVAVAPVVQRVVESLRKVHAQRKLAIAADVDSAAYFRGDEGDLLEIVGNLADNACKWARSRVTIKIARRATTSAEEPGGLLVEVADDGPGIPEGEIGRAMQRGARLDESVAGHGIGLAIVREMVEDAYGGRLRFESSTSGTTVRADIEFAG